MLEQVLDPPCLPARDAHGHKGTFGTVAVVGGCGASPGGDGRVMIGAPALVANAALRTGCGLAVLMMPGPILSAAMSIAPCATAVELPVHGDGTLDASGAVARLDAQLAGTRCLAVGPGLGAVNARDPAGGPAALVLRAIWQEDVPLVLDADGLNLLAGMTNPTMDFHASAVLTPHPGEYRRLAATFAIDADPVDPEQRPRAAAELAQRLGCVVVLKGPRTVVSDGRRYFENPTGNATLAVGGSGDVLTGVIGSLIAQFSPRFSMPQPVGKDPCARDLFECARLGVYLHGLAADRWARHHGDAGMLATDLIDELPATLAYLRRPDAVQ
jgi:ADP-dependent NAD(P)H-hydrate dehydratase